MPWYALHVRSNCERRVRDALARQAIENYLPLYTERSRWSDRTKQIERALFPGYVFGHFDLDSRRKIVEIPGLVRILGVGTHPAPVSNEEISRVKQIVDSGLAVEPVPYLTEGQKVRVARGALTGVEGIIVRFKDSFRVVVSVELLRRSVAAELDTDALVPIEPLKRAA